MNVLLFCLGVMHGGGVDFFRGWCRLAGQRPAGGRHS